MFHKARAISIRTVGFHLFSSFFSPSCFPISIILISLSRWFHDLKERKDPKAMKLSKILLIAVITSTLHQPSQPSMGFRIDTILHWIGWEIMQRRDGFVLQSRLPRRVHNSKNHTEADRTRKIVLGSASL